MTPRFLKSGIVAAALAVYVINCAWAETKPLISAVAAGGDSVATFAGGCFWCVESDFDHVSGVTKTISGYTGGLLEEPSYSQVSAGSSGHIEAVQIYFDPKKTSYDKLLDVFWRSVDATDSDGQFCDRGDSYATAIFANSLEQKKIAEASRSKLKKSVMLKRVVTPVRLAMVFYPAERYHQDYYKKNPLRYRFYRLSCGRDARVRELWGAEAHEGIDKH